MPLDYNKSPHTLTTRIPLLRGNKIVKEDFFSAKLDISPVVPIDLDYKYIAQSKSCG